MRRSRWVDGRMHGHMWTTHGHTCGSYEAPTGTGLTMAVPLSLLPVVDPSPGGFSGLARYIARVGRVRAALGAGGAAMRATRHEAASRTHRLLNPCGTCSRSQHHAGDGTDVPPPSCVALRKLLTLSDAYINK